MKFSAAVLALALAVTETDAFFMPSTRMGGVSSSTTSLHAGGAKFIKKLLVPNAKDVAPKAEPIPFKDIPDITLDAPVLADSATPAITAASPTVTDSVSQAATTSQVVAATARRAAKVKEVAAVPPAVESPAPTAVQEAMTQPPTTPHVNPSTPDEFLNSFQPIKGMEVDWTEKVDDSYRANIQNAASSFDWKPPISRWSGFDLGAWFQNKMKNGWGSSGPVNAGPPKVLDKIDPDAALQWRQWENAGVEQFLTSYTLFKMSVADTAALLSGGTAYSQDDFERALNLKETSGWYLAVAGTLGVAWWNLAMGESSGSGAAAVAVPRGGTVVKEVAVNEAKLNQLQAADDAIAKREAAVADQVSQLTAATTAVTKQLAELNAAKAQRDYDVATMKSDLREMRNELYVAARSEQELRASLQRTQAKLDSETASLRKQLEERIAAEAAVQEQLKSTKSKMEKELKTIADAKDQAEQEVVHAKKQVTALEKEKKAMEQEIATLQAQVQDLQEKLDGPKKTTTKGSKATETPASPPVAKKAAVSEKKESQVPTTKAKKETVVAKKEEPKKATAKEPKKAVAKKAASKKAVAKKATAKKAVDTEEDVLANLSKAFFANITEPVGSAVEPTGHKVSSSDTKTIQVKKAPQTSSSTKKEASPSAVADSDDDWSSMSKTSLQRKKVKELQDYLKERVPDAKLEENGRALKKAELVEQILSA
eukprot:scaffold448_cov156-Amphora_coffeaeformis.AAC.4